MSGALLLGLISAVFVVDMLLALNFRRKADAAESNVGAAPTPGAADPAALRRLAAILFITAPLMWLVVAALSFGLIPIDGIIPVKF